MMSIIKNFTLFFCFCLTFLLGLAIFGYFVFAFVLFAVLLSFFGFLLSLFYLFRNKKLKIKKFDICIIAGIILFALFLSFFHHGLPDGRDDASYMSAAIMLTKTGSLSFDDELTRAFTGFRNLFDNAFTSQFLPGYVVYLGTFFLFGGINAMLWANFLLIFLFLFLTYFIVKKLTDKKTCLLFLAIIGTFYTTFWFTRRLNSENLFMVLFWFSVFLIIDGLKNKKINALFLSLFPLFLACLVRAETLFYLIMAVLLIAIILIKKSLRESFFENKIVLNLKFWLSVSLPIVVAFLFGFYLKLYSGLSYFYKQFYNPWQIFSKFLIVFVILLIAGLLLYYYFKKIKCNWFDNIIIFTKQYFQKIILWLVVLSFLLYEILLFCKGQNLSWSFYQVQFNLKTLGLYFVLFCIIIIFLGLNKKLFDKWILILTILILPSFLFLIRAQIAIDQPWFMRRFYPIFLPYIFILVSFVYFRLKSQNNSLLKFVKTCLIVLIIINFLVSLPIMFYSENKDAQAQVEKMAKQFNKNDLIIMDPGWNWQKWSYALHYLYGVNVIPRQELASKSKFVDEIFKNKNKLNNNQTVIDLKNYYDQESFKKLSEIVAKYSNVYFIIDKAGLIVYPYKFDNLNKISEIKLDYKNLSFDSLLIKYLKDNDVKKKNVAKRIIYTPPILKSDENFDLILYKAKDKNVLILPEKVYPAENIEEYRDYFEKLVKTDF